MSFISRESIAISCGLILLTLTPLYSISKKEQQLLVKARVVEVLEKKEDKASMAVFQAQVLETTYTSKKIKKPRYQKGDEVEVFGVLGQNVYLEHLQVGATCFALMSERPSLDQELWHIQHIKAPVNMGRIIGAKETGLDEVSDEMKEYLTEMGGAR